MFRDGILSGREISRQIKKGNIFISDFDKSRLNPNSYNLRLHNEIMMYSNDPLDMKRDNPTWTMKIPESGLKLIPGAIYLGRTSEYTKTEKFIPMLEGRSSVGRLGICVHVTAGFGDVGFAGYWTLELFCIQPVIIYPGVDICQIYYHTIKGKYDPYKSGKYQNNSGIQASRMYMDFLKDGGAK